MDNQYWQDNGLICPYCNCDYNLSTQVKIETCFRGILTLRCLCPCCHEELEIVLETKIV